MINMYFLAKFLYLPSLGDAPLNASYNSAGLPVTEKKNSQILRGCAGIEGGWSYAAPPLLAITSREHSR